VQSRAPTALHTSLASDQSFEVLQPGKGGWLLAPHTSSAPKVPALAHPKVAHELREHSMAGVGTGVGAEGAGVGQLALPSARASAQHAA
jgi:hypothetical protein